jgi:hypothetical protein
MFRTSLIETSVINTHSPFTIFLFYKHKISQPLRMEYLLDEFGRQQLAYLLPDCPTLLVEAA